MITEYYYFMTTVDNLVGIFSLWSLISVKSHEEKGSLK